MTSHEPAPQLPRETMRAADGGDIRVLVVDDEPRLTELLTMALRYEGWAVRSAASGEQALGVAGAFRPHAVVLDVMLPDLDGLAVLERLRDGTWRGCGCRTRPGMRRGERCSTRGTRSRDHRASPS